MHLKVVLESCFDIPTSKNFSAVETMCGYNSKTILFSTWMVGATYLKVVSNCGSCGLTCNEPQHVAMYTCTYLANLHYLLL